MMRVKKIEYLGFIFFAFVVLRIYDTPTSKVLSTVFYLAMLICEYYLVIQIEA